MKIQKFISKSPIVPALLSAKWIETKLSSALGGKDFSIWEGLILSAVFFEDRACRPSEIARTLQMSRSQMSQILKRLEKSELLKRELSKESARFIDLSLTAKGRKAALRAIKVFDRTTDEIEKGLGTHAAEVLASGLLKLPQLSSS